MIKIAIIGAGLSGLTIANKIKDKAHVVIFEKARGVGGRIATRRAEPYQFDHGAQFFKAKTHDFKSFIDPMIKDGVLKAWEARFAEIDNGHIINKRQWSCDDPHYVGVSSMNAMAKFLSKDLTIQLNTKVSSIKKYQDKWIVEDSEGANLGEYDWVISTIPAEQMFDIFESSQLKKPAIEKVQMQGCFSLMLGFQRPLELEFDAALIRGADISWVSVNSSKPGRKKAFSLLVHSTNKWADEHIDDNKTEVLQYLCREVSEVIGVDLSQADHKDIHCWRYANVAKQKGVTHYIDGKNKICVCGDWFIHGRVESAFITGHDLSSSLLKIIS